MAMNYDGKTYRNLQEQVGYLTAKWQELANEIDELRAQIPSKMIVEELPETGDPLITYYVGPKGTAPNQYYEVWIWVQEEEDGPFVWRELEDTDQVDLSGYLPIQDGVTSLPQAYIKTEAGVQAMMNMDIAATALTIMARDSNGRTKVAAPSADGDAANKKYCDDGFVSKQTGASAMYKVYGKSTSGDQGMLDVTSEKHGATLAFRDANGTTKFGTPTDSEHAATKGYVDGGFVAKDTAVTSFPRLYSKNPDGTQGFLVVNMYTSTEGNVPIYQSGGRLVVGAPTSNSDAATKQYVDAAVGQLIYKHEITLGFTVNSRIFSLDIVVLNGTSTAYTSTDGRHMLTSIKTSACNITTSSWVDNKFWSVVVCPSDKYIHDETGVGFLLTAGVDGTTIYVDGIDPSYNSDISNVTISDVVTTW